MEKKRREFLAPERAELWRRWKEGESVSDIARALDRQPGTIHSFIAATGGIAPARRRRNVRTLSLEEREDISRGLCAGLSIRAIAARLGRWASTISREIDRNGGRVQYRAITADSRAWVQAERPKLCKLATNTNLQSVVATKLQLQWSPEQIAGWLKKKYPNDDSMQISHETIYRSLFIQARGVLKKELQKHLRSRRLIRRSKKATTSGQNRGQIIDAVAIRQRPAEVEDRAIPGHWEGDLISGSKNSHIATLVERQSRFTMLIKVNGKDTETVIAALTKQIQRLPTELRRSLTWDRGPEMAKHKDFSVDTDMAVYFCDPQSPWQRGTNENTNRLLRQYFPKGTDLSLHSQTELNKVARRLNQRPRKTLAFRTPSDTLQEALQ